MFIDPIDWKMSEIRGELLSYQYNKDCAQNIFSLNAFSIDAKEDLFDVLSFVSTDRMPIVYVFDSSDEISNRRRTKIEDIFSYNTVLTSYDNRLFLDPSMDRNAARVQ